MINIQDFIHPDDASALNNLKSIPALPTLLEKVIQYGYEEMDWSRNIASNVRINERQMPEIYCRLIAVCRKLQMPIPELYLQMSPIPNAWTSGNTRTYIVVTLGLIRRFQEEELDAVLAHECGHILCHHVLYSMLANAIFDLGDSLMDSILGSIGNAAMIPIKQALLGWSRASELSADRVACVVSSPETMIRVLAKLDGIPPIILKDMNLDEWSTQGADYEKMRHGSGVSKVVRYISNTDLTHPYGPVRAYEVRRWSGGAHYLKLQSQMQQLTDGKTCPMCGAAISEDWAFCRSCGAKLK